MYVFVLLLLSVTIAIESRSQRTDSFFAARRLALDVARERQEILTEVAVDVIAKKAYNKHARLDKKAGLVAPFQGYTRDSEMAAERLQTFG